MKKLNTKTLVSMALLVAIEIVLSRFLSIQAWNIKIGFSFVPIAIAAIWYGPLGAGLVAAMGDFLGAVLFPFVGPYFPGFTVTALLTGVLFGLCLYKNRGTIGVLIAVLVNQFVLGLFLNTYWISVLYKSPFVPLLSTRIIQALILFVIQFAVIRAILPFAEKMEKLAQNEA